MVISSSASSQRSVAVSSLHSLKKTWFYFYLQPLNLLDQLFDGLIEYDKIAKAEQPEVHTCNVNSIDCLNNMTTVGT